MADLYWEDDTHKRYGVLVSAGFGAGWSSWSNEALAYDRKVIEYWLTHKYSHLDEVKEWLAANGYPHTYVSETNWRTLQLEWVSAGAHWRIREYDGAESIEFLNPNDWTCFN